MTKVAVSGYFDPLHIGHIELFKLARALGDSLVVIVNNDKQTKMKKGKVFMLAEERKKIIQELSCVSEAIVSIDTDRTVCKSLELVKPNIFANGGDRKKQGSTETNTDIPESKICNELNIKIVDGLGDKIQSSFKLVKNFEDKGEVA
ncbi:adenylyltransferase/cytidyltransferase family protein [Candidatus Pacearchaeota archaeon]|nr:adenylyltransferase/cytidyltransferase family protein [Candidatus Pacearchaeota archaeon]